MKTKQQRETLEYFKKHAAEWRLEAEGSGASGVNVIEQRNGYVLQVASERSHVQSFLDIGCGTGELVCQMAERGVPATGVDYAQPMIDLASRKAANEGISKARFVCSSIFDLDLSGKGYDLMAANGLIEYLSHGEMFRLFDLIAQFLPRGGSFVVGSRNRLFNLVSMNEFTSEEIETGAADLLLRESISWSGARDLSDIDSTDCAELQAPETQHANTGIDVNTRFQYSPLQLIKLLSARRLRPVEVYPVHIHGVIPAFGRAHDDIHSAIANLLQGYGRHNLQLLSQASTFMLHVTKED